MDQFTNNVPFEPVTSPLPRQGRLARVLAHIGGGDADRLESASLFERIGVRRTGLALLSSVAFVTLTVATGLGVALGPAPSDRFAAVAVASLVASILALLDHAMIQSHTVQAALAAADRRGFRISDPHDATSRWRIVTLVRRGLSAGGRNLFAFTIRVALSLSIAFTVASLALLVLFEKDLTRRIAADHRTANAELYTRVGKEIDRDLDRREVEIQQIDRSLAAHEATIARLTVEAANIALAEDGTRREQIATLDRERNVALAEAQRRRADAHAEEFGIREQPRHSGTPGKSSRYAFAVAQATLAESRANDLTVAIDRLVAAPLTGSVEPMLARLREERAVLAASRVDRIAELAAARSAREGEITHIAQSTPGFVPYEDGLVRRLDAMQALQRESGATFALATALKVALMLAEMAGLVARLIVGGASAHAVGLALDTESAISTAIRDTEDVLAENDRARLESADHLAHARSEHLAEARRRRTGDTARARAEAMFGAGLRDMAD
jgi:hypothetical protein